MAILFLRDLVLEKYGGIGISIMFSGSMTSFVEWKAALSMRNIFNSSGLCLEKSSRYFMKNSWQTVSVVIQKLSPVMGEKLPHHHL
jgi:hypothetical protein